MVEQSKVAADYIDTNYESWFVAGLAEFIRIPNLTTLVDPTYLTNGNLEKSIDLVHNYIEKLNIERLTRTIYKTEGGMPLIVYIVEPAVKTEKTINVMMYGHLDKQPYGDGWFEGLSPTDPMRKGDIMYGRGSSDDGYAPFACLMAVKATQLSGVPMPRIALTLECEEESGSPNLIPLLDMAFPLIQKPDIMICMDSGALNYDQLWMTSSLRGRCMVDVCVEVANQGYHSGETGGIIPESFRIQRVLLDRLDDCVTGKVISDLQVELPAWK